MARRNPFGGTLRTTIPVNAQNRLGRGSRVSDFLNPLGGNQGNRGMTLPEMQRDGSGSITLSPTSRLINPNPNR